MRLTNFTDYGLRILMRIAGEPDRVHATSSLAEEFGLPRNHLAKIVQRLAEGGIITTRRGNGGGTELARAAEQIRLGDLIQLLERNQALVDCWPGSSSSCSINGQCRLKTKLRRAESMFIADMNKSTLKDIALQHPPPIRMAMV